MQDLLETLQDLKPVPADEQKGISAAAAVAAGGMNPIFTRTLPLGTPLPPSMRGGNATGRAGGASRPVDEAPTISAPEESAALARAAEQASESFSRPAAVRPAAPAPAPAPAPFAKPSAAPSTAGWAAQGRVPGQSSSGESGPTAGMARPSKSGEAAFVNAQKAGALPDIRGEYENGRFVPTYYTDDDLVIPRQSRAALWIILVSLVLLAGAAIAVYMFLYTGGDEEENTAVPVAAAIDAGAAAAPQPQPTVQPAIEPAIAEAVAALAADSEKGLEAAAENLAGLASQPAAAASGRLQVARSRVESALAQRLADGARLAATPAEGKPLADKAKARATAARAAADAALAAEGDHKSAALIALADAQRLQGEKTVEVERILRQARQGPPPATAELAREADLVGGLLLARDDRLRDARVLFDRLAKEATDGDLRARFRLAWIDFIEGNAAGARSAVEAILAAQPEHAGAKLLAARLAAPPAPTPAVPPPGGDKPTPPVAGDKPPAGKPAPPKPPAEESSAAALKRANKLAENGSCEQAMPLFRKVLDDNPSNVEALTGLGFCHLDRKEYASAHTRFRAALGISSRYQDAMWGIAEMYQRQGNAEEAIAKYQAFIDAYPTTRRAAAARKQIEKLSGSSGGGGGGDSSGGDPTPPDPEVDPGGGDEFR